MIENMLHKHRYFGHSGEIHECRPWSVTTVTPMKRGLKASTRSNTTGSTRRVTDLYCYNRYPDEKGTERNVSISGGTNTTTGCVVTTVTPMKRGLKDNPPEIYCCYIPLPETYPIDATPRGYNRYPDEKGTESLHPWINPSSLFVTTVTPMKRGLKAASFL